MKKPRLPRFSLFGDTAVGALWYLMLVVVLPVSSLVIAGLVFLWRGGLLLDVLGGWLAVTLCAYGLFVLFPLRQTRRALARAGEPDATSPPDDGSGTQEAIPAPGGVDDTSTLPHRLSPQSDWTGRDRRVYDAVCRRIEELVGETPAWDAMRTNVLGLVEFVASEYHGPSRNNRLRFTLPEALLVVSVASDRYRHLVQTHVPFADRISLSTVASIAERKDDIRRGAIWVDRLRRGGRLVNPVGAVLGELRDQFTNRVFTSASRALQRDLMRLLLQEIAQVCIDLYSGRLKVSGQELDAHRSRALEADATRAAEPVEPLRVLLLGQISAGKSSLVNALAEAFAAETDLLPTTDRSTVHVLTLDGLPPLHLVDTPGLDDDPERRRRMVDAALEADVLVWVARANRPGRAPDAELRAAIDESFEKRPERRPPPALLVLTHVDQLSPRKEWSPPYALDGTPTDDDATSLHDTKGAAILAALESARRQIGLTDSVPGIPVRLGDAATSYNTDTVAATLLLSADAAAAAQLNRRRIDRTELTRSWRNRLSQTRHLATGIGKALWRSV